MSVQDIYIATGGSTLYNTRNSFSDNDIRVIYVRDVVDYYKLNTVNDNPEQTNALGIDCVRYELRDFVRKIVSKHSAECFELLYDPTPVYVGKLFIPLLKEIAPYLLSQQVKKHYILSGIGLYEKWQKTGVNSFLADAVRRMIMASRLNEELSLPTSYKLVETHINDWNNIFKTKALVNFSPVLATGTFEHSDVMSIKNGDKVNGDSIFNHHKEKAMKDGNLPLIPQLELANRYLKFVGDYLCNIKAENQSLVNL